MRLGIFGGSFDPIHLGHLILAQTCLEHAALDQVLFIPNSRSPLKPDGAVATDRQRTEMVDLAIGGNEAFLRDDLEIKRGGDSYTIETLTAIGEQQPDAELFLMIGADSLESLDRWKSPELILAIATPLVFARPGSGPPNFANIERFVDDQKMEAMQQMAITSRQIDISSTAIRTSVATGLSVRYLTPRSVEKYIETQKIYR